MIKSVNIVWLFVLLFALFLPLVGYAEIIDSFVSEISVQTNGTFKVRETIEYDFESEDRRGIFREIPLTFSNDGNERQKIEVTDVAVKRDGLAEQFSDKSSRNSFNVRIGNPDVIISGKHSYELSYVVAGAIQYGDDIDQLVWNVTGNSWPVDISNASVSLIMPSGISVIQKSCYRGDYGETGECDPAGQVGYSASNLVTGEGLTVAWGFPTGYIERLEIASTWKEEYNFLFFLLPLFVFFRSRKYWKKYGKELRGSGSIYAQYEPPENMSAMMVGIVYDNSIDGRDVSAAIVDAAQQGYLKIEYIPKKNWFSSDNYKLSILKKFDEKIGSLTKELLTVFFPSNEVGKIVSLNDLRNDRSFGQKIVSFRQDALGVLENQGLYEPRSKTRRMMLMAGGVIVVFIGVGAVSSGLIFAPPLGLSLFIAGIVMMIFGYKMPKRTKAGVKALEHVKGFREYVSMTETERYKFHTPVKRTPEMYYGFLPYAIALGVEKEWSRQFKNMTMSDPAWYSAPSGASFNAVVLGSAMNSFSRGVSRTGSSSSGGGFSGGGAGGGGGGSW